MSNRKRRRIQEPEPATISRPPKVSVDNQPAPKDGSPRVVDEVLPPNQIAYIAGQTTESVVDALIDDPDSWSKADNGLYIHGDMTGTYVSIGDPGGKADFNAKDAYAKILEMGDEVAQTMLFIMARCLSNNEPTEKIRIHVNDSLGFRGISRHRKRDFRPDQKRAEARRFRLLSDIWVTAVDTIEVRVGRGKKAKKINVTSRLIEFELLSEAEVSSAATPLTLPSVNVTNAFAEVPYAFRVGLGGWARAYVQAGSSQVRAMLNKIIQYDVGTDAGRYAMRIGLAMMLRNMGNEQTIKIVLENARIKIPERDAADFKLNLEVAFGELRHDGVISDWQYTYSTDLPKTRWISKWLTWRVIFTAPRQVVNVSPTVKAIKTETISAAH